MAPQRVLVVEDGLEAALEEPLLQAAAAAAAAAAASADDDSPLRSPAAAAGRCGTAGGMANIVVTAVGAGMVALPHAVSRVGLLLGLALFALTAALTYCSTAIIVSYAGQWRHTSYGQLVHFHFGASGAAILQLAIVVHVGGVMVGYCVILSDVLVGSAPAFEGVLPTLLGRHDGAWWLSRPAVLGGLLAAVVAPMLVPRSLAAVARFSRLSVGMLFLLASVISSLAGVAVARGAVAPGVQWLPTPAAIGATPLAALTSVLTVVSVSALAFTCHFNLLPVQASLEDSSPASMQRVLSGGLAFCALLYATVAASGYLLFGSATDGDVLKNLTAAAVGQLVPPPAAAALVYFVAAAFTFNLLVNFVLKVWAVRENLCELALGLPASRLSAPPFYALTAALVLGAYGLSTLIPSIYALLALVGSTACVTFSYFFPGAIVLKCQSGWAPRAGALCMIALGALMAAVAIANQLRGDGE